MTFRLRTFGGPLIEGPGGPLTGAVTQRRRLAALSLLAASNGAMSRDRLLAFLWPESDKERARHALAQLLYSLRRDLGEDVITGGTTTLLLNRSVLESDVAELEAALQRGDLERAVSLYAGPFLEGFYLSGCAEFERWVEDQRTRFHDRTCEALQTIAAAAAGAGDSARAVHAWRRAAALSPYDSRIALSLMQALAAAGDSAGAIQYARIHTGLVRDRLESEPDPAITAYVASLTSTPSQAPTVPPSDARPLPAEAAAVPGSEPHPVPDGAVSSESEPRRFNRRRRHAATLGALAITAVAAVAVVLQLASDRVPVQPSWVLIADVENSTGDPVFDRTLPVAFAAALAQSSLVHVTSPERVQQALFRMRSPAQDTVLDERLAVQLARREGIRAVIVPVAVPSGEGYELGARIVDSQTSSVLGARTVRAESRAAVLDALDRAGRELRRELGESLRSVTTNTVALPLVTTASLDALKSYADGQRAFGLGRWTEAETLFKKAVTHDSSFASAHAALGALSFWLNRPTEGSQHFERALRELSDLPERERILIRASALGWRGDRVASAELLRSYLIGNPGDPLVLSRLGYDLLRLNQDAEAADVYQRYLAIDSMSWSAWLNLATVERHIGRPDSSIQHYRRAFTLAPWAETGNDNVNLEYGTTYLMVGDTPSAEAVFSKMLVLDRSRRARGLRSMAFLALVKGDYRNAGRQLTEAIAINRATNAPVSEIRNRLLLASTLEQLGEPTSVLEQLDSAYVIGQRTDMEPTLLFWLGKALARAGNAQRAERLLATLESTAIAGSGNRAALEGLRGEVRVARHDAAAAIAHLEAMIHADSSAYTLESLAFGVAASGDLERAAGLYTQLNTSAVFGWEGQQYNRLAGYWLGLVEERRGRRAEAVRAFQAFLDDWRGADPSLSSLVDARARLVRLRLADTPR